MTWGDRRIEKRLVMPYKQNTVYIEYRYVEGPGIRLGLRPGIHFAITMRLSIPRRAHSTSSAPPTIGWRSRRVRASRPAFEDHTSNRLYLRAQNLAIDYSMEKSRGYPSKGTLWSPGYFRADLDPGSAIVLTASTERGRSSKRCPTEEALSAERSRSSALIQKAPSARRRGIVPELVLAADQFLITPVGRRRRRRPGARRRRRAAHRHCRIPLVHRLGPRHDDQPGRSDAGCGTPQEARWILRTFAHYVRDGLIPNMFPEGEKQGLYHTADASLWFFHAMSRYLAATGDRITLHAILPQLHEIANAHIAGTHFGIHVDPEDGLLVQGQEGYQLTWMDAKVGDWVVTPRRGKAVEINALWYNALCLLE